MVQVEYTQLTPEHFQGVITLGNDVHGDNYLDDISIAKLYEQSFHNDINASWVALQDNTVKGFRLTIAAPNWQPDKWCSPQLWGVATNEVCYFKCNTVDASMRGLGVGSKLLSLSIEKAKLQGSKAGLAHIWLASPGNSAFKYFSKCGGRTVKEHPGKWARLCIEDGYECPVCPGICECVAAEMILPFEE